MSEFELDLEKRSQLSGDYLSVRDMPDTLELTVLKQEYKLDGRGKECLYITFQIASGEHMAKKVVQKYTPSTYTDLHEAIQKAGGWKQLTSLEPHKWTKQASGRTINQRLFPEPKPKTKR